jgi:hypothetical protein
MLLFFSLLKFLIDLSKSLVTFTTDMFENFNGKEESHMV